uniref:Raptor_N domain-containing protein n=1 Tax=Heterorhabditis bacteriophora TaxID=37862 RepID=A0A1I7X8W7_HETBA
MKKEGEPALPYVASLFRRHSDQIMKQKTEHRVAVTVCAVVTSFTITQAPSAIVLCVNSLWNEMPYRSSSQWLKMPICSDNIHSLRQSRLTNFICKEVVPKYMT